MHFVNFVMGHQLVLTSTEGEYCAFCDVFMQKKWKSECLVEWSYTASIYAVLKGADSASHGSWCRWFNQL